MGVFSDVGGCRGRAAGGTDAEFGPALAAILGEVGEQRIHAAIVGGIEDGTACAPRRHQPGAAELRQME
jgi:hypothetical protein